MRFLRFMRNHNHVCFQLARFIAVLSTVIVTLSSGCQRHQQPTTDAVHNMNPRGEPVPAIASISGLTPEDAMLGEARQQQIWEGEHATHLIEHRFGVRFREALKSKSITDLTKLIDPAALIELKDWRQSTNVSVSLVTSEQSNPNANVWTADRVELATWLLDLHAMEIQKVSLRVLAIEGDAATDTWHATLLLTADGRSGQGPTKRIASTHRVRFRWDSAEELEQSGVVQDWRIESIKTSSSGSDLMVEVTNDAGLQTFPIGDNWNLPFGRTPQMIRFQMAVADYDRDGLLDIAVSSAGNNFLLKNVGNKFASATRRAGIHPTSVGERVDISAGWIDIDNDGFPDLILGGRVYRNDQGIRFVDVTAESGIQFRPHHMGCAVADFNMDGHTDVYFVYAHDNKRNTSTQKGWIGDEQSGGSNQLWQNQGDGTFVDVTDEAGVAGGRRQSFAANWLFANNDHFPDLYVANDFGTNSLFLNRGDGTFEDISSSSGTADFATSMGVASGDLDNDGNVEIYVANMYSKMGRRIVGQVKKEDYPPGILPRLQGACAGSRLYRSINSETPRFTEVSDVAGVNKIGWAYAPTFADFNNDGLLDIYATCGFLSVNRSKPDG